MDKNYRTISIRYSHQFLAVADVYSSSFFGSHEIDRDVKVSLVTGPKPGPPRNVSVTEISNGFLVTWQQPAERSHLVQYYTIKSKTDGPWKMVNKGQIRPEETSFLGNYLSILSSSRG